MGLVTPYSLIVMTYLVFWVIFILISKTFSDVRWINYSLETGC
jgi:hypothetical protein